MHLAHHQRIARGNGEEYIQYLPSVLHAVFIFKQKAVVLKHDQNQHRTLADLAIDIMWHALFFASKYKAKAYFFVL